MNLILRKYANLLVDYCLDIQAGEKLYVKTSTAGEPLLKEVYRAALKKGAIVEYDLVFSEEARIRLHHSEEEQLKHVPILSAHAMEHFDAYLVIRAPHNLLENHANDSAKIKIRNKSLKPYSEMYTRRTAEGSLKRSLCQYPTQASAQMAGMSLEEYTYFVFNACRLFDENPQASWLKVREEQQRFVDHLDAVDEVRYVGHKTDIRFSVKGRKWMNSDGRTNMPSGEVFSGPVEDSVNGEVYFSYPSVFMSKAVEGIHLKVENGQVMEWTAEIGQDVLDEVFKVPGARYFGEVAIGTNYNIQKPTKNILFDEKIGGTIHMAVGQSYLQTGGLNKSDIHWDMITDMTNGGQIYTDGQLIYKDGKFLI